MDAVHNDVNAHKNETSATIDSPKVERLTDGENYSESNTLLPPKKGGILRKSERTDRKVQWNDKNGNKLAEIIVFEPSDASDSDDEDSDSDSCICIIM
ncbi:Actin-related protein 2/3 complex subunit 2 [Hibiscus syriacus]|uniref:Actin-related protein 2/3 complex subunit 2 n=1 Tax=Hibiscus syriacus TaxID=106335 RepID=A0A6A3D2I9_HIBSY|nr:Actin-related protein 2/3 complex subunit 2 [Hibiscus syriacus]